MLLSKIKTLPLFLLTFLLCFGFCITAYAEDKNPFGNKKEQEKDLGTLIVDQSTKYENNKSVALFNIPVENDHYYKLTIETTSTNNNFNIEEAKLVYTPDTRFLGLPVSKFSYKYSDTQLTTDIKDYLNKKYTRIFKGQNQPFVIFKASGKNGNPPPSFHFKIYLKDYGVFKYGKELYLSNPPTDEITLTSTNNKKKCYYYLPEERILNNDIFSNDTFNHYINIKEEGKLEFEVSSQTNLQSVSLCYAYDLDYKIEKHTPDYLHGAYWNVKPGRYFLKVNMEPDYNIEHAPLKFIYSSITFEPKKPNNTKSKTTVSTPSAVKVKASKKSLIITFKKSKNATGYQVQYAKNKKFTKAKSKKIKTNKVTIKKLKKGKYFVRVRAFKKKKGKTTYSKWSINKTINIK